MARLKVQTPNDECLYFSSYRASCQYFSITCSQEGRPLLVEPIEKLPPGFSMQHPKASATEMEIGVQYDLFENGKKLKPEGGGFECRVKVEDNSQCFTFRIHLKFHKNETKPAATDCHICAEEYDRAEKLPIALDCGHSYCLSCLKKDEATRTHGNLPAFRCPKDKVPNEKAIMSLPTNCAILDMLDELEEKPVGRINYLDPELACFWSPDQEAHWWCDGCQQQYCKDCFIEAHKGYHIADHKAIPLYQRPTAPPKCPLHPEKDAIFVCQQTQCPTGHHIFCITCQKSVMYHQGHPFEDLRSYVSNHGHVIPNLLQELIETEQIVDDNYKRAKISMASFEKDSDQADAARKMIEGKHRELPHRNLAEFEGWRERQYGRRSEELTLCSQVRNKHYVQSICIKRKADKYEPLQDLEKILENGDEVIKKSRQEKLYLNLQDYYKTSANGMEDDNYHN